MSAHAAGPIGRPSASPARRRTSPSGSRMFDRASAWRSAAARRAAHRRRRSTAPAKLTWDFITSFPSITPTSRGHRGGALGHDLADGRLRRCSSSRSASRPRSTSRSTPTARAGGTASSRSTSRTSPRSRRSSTASSGSPSSCAGRCRWAACCSPAALTLGLLVLPVVIIAGARGDPRRAAVDPRGLDGARRDPVADDLAAGAAGARCRASRPA